MIKEVNWIPVTNEPPKTNRVWVKRQGIDGTSTCFIEGESWSITIISKESLKFEWHTYPTWNELVAAHNVIEYMEIPGSRSME